MKNFNNLSKNEMKNIEGGGEGSWAYQLGRWAHEAFCSFVDGYAEGHSRAVNRWI